MIINVLYACALYTCILKSQIYLLHQKKMYGSLIIKKFLTV